ncbi:MAG: GIY-YIG nuclease family protein [Chloroflexi bacterium]|nr:GIY-YIG nuclease family protein [Chloroflexota bacterium]
MPEKPQVHYVYFIHQPSPCCLKIGMTGNLRRRVKQILRGNPNRLFLEGAIECPNMRTAKRIEEALHVQYGNYRLAGEWFSISLEEVNKIGTWLYILGELQPVECRVMIRNLREELR